MYSFGALLASAAISFALGVLGFVTAWWLWAIIFIAGWPVIWLIVRVGIKGDSFGHVWEVMLGGPDYPDHGSGSDGGSDSSPCDYSDGSGGGTH